MRWFLFSVLAFLLLGCVSQSNQLAPGVLADRFLDLSDTPGSYSGDANSFVTVNSSANGLVFSKRGMGEVSYFNSTGVTVSIAAQSDGNTNFVHMAPATVLTDGNLLFDNNGSDNGALRYMGVTEKHFHTAITLSFAPAGANDLFVIGLCKNGSFLFNGKVLQKLPNALDTQAMSYHVMVDLKKVDVISACIGNLTDADDLTLKSLNIFAMQGD